MGMRHGDDEAWTRYGLSVGYGDIFNHNDPVPEPKINFMRYGIDLEIEHPHFFLNTEYVTGTNEVSGEKVPLEGYYINLAWKIKENLGPLLRFDVTSKDGTEIFRRWTAGGFWGKRDDDVRVLFNYEYRDRADGLRADDKYYLWLQVKI